MLEASNQAIREINPKKRQQRTFWKFYHKFLRDTVYISILKDMFSIFLILISTLLFNCLQFWIRQGTIGDIGPFLFSVHIYCPCVPFRFLALNTFYILETLKYMYPIQNTPLISESLYPLLQKPTIMCVISIQVLLWTYRICQPVKGEGTWDILQDVRYLSLDYSYNSPQMQWFSNCVSKNPLKYFTDS